MRGDRDHPVGRVDGRVAPADREPVFRAPQAPLRPDALGRSREGVHQGERGPRHPVFRKRQDVAAAPLVAGLPDPAGRVLLDPRRGARDQAGDRPETDRTRSSRPSLAVHDAEPPLPPGRGERCRGDRDGCGTTLDEEVRRAQASSSLPSAAVSAALPRCHSGASLSVGALRCQLDHSSFIRPDDVRGSSARLSGRHGAAALPAGA